MMIKVRNAEAKDFAAWSVLWKGYLNFYGSELDESVTLATWQRVLTPGSGMLCRLAESDNHVVGFAVCVLHPGTWVTEPLCYLEDLYVDENQRGIGAGRALIEALRDEAQQKSWSKVYWVTRESNPARALYDKLALLDDFVRYTIKI
ncbi:GNAT family N-acetyltransferase [Pantoea sp. BIGb0393]|uniref:GNAT family N-acetyltransferase n=1 Tax=Pantoea nemavictus TaxID=2726955 RepID=A0ABU8PYF2_9GAMM|nr:MULTISPECIES: GNAT family N-acetyltransferase [Pantoea]KNC05779.1 GNAT family acetyltransferase [Pantoea sp. RIT-PI-b]MBA0038796.1 GNAT family N-acetyltransferase [Pantoea nemavictus]